MPDLHPRGKSLFDIGQAVLGVLSVASLVAWIVSVATSKTHHPLDFWLVVFFALLAASFGVWGLRQRRERDIAVGGTHYHFGDRSVVTIGSSGGTQDVSFSDWLGQQVQELRGLMRRLEEVLPADPFEPNEAYAVQEHLWEIVRDVDRRLHTSAPEWVDYFNEDHARYPVELAFPKADLYANQIVPAIESTIDQIAHIQARLEARRPPKGKTANSDTAKTGGRAESRK